jgi:hypothetical protein
MAYVSRSSVLGSVVAVLLTLSIAGCGGGSGGNEPAANPTPDPSGGVPVQPVTAPALGVTANENFAGENFVDVDKYNQAIDNYNAMGSDLAGDAP